MTEIMLDMLVGSKLTIVRLYGTMAGFHFGDVRRHPRGGTVGAFAFHVDCPWRLDNGESTVTGNYDRWDYPEVGNPPEGWNPDSGPTLRDKKLSELLGMRAQDGSWFNQTGRFVVLTVNVTKWGDVAIEMSGQYFIRAFPTATAAEAWRLFRPNDEATHIIFPTGVIASG